MLKYSILFPALTLLGVMADAAPIYRVRSLPNIDGREFRAKTINDHGQIAGIVNFREGQSSTEWHSYVFDPGAGFTAIPYENPHDYPPGDMLATKINNRGEVTGYNGGNGENAEAYRWSPSGGLAWLPHYSNFPQHIPWTMNNLGVIIGDAYNPTWTTQRSVVWDASNNVSSYGSRVLYDINDNGRIVGWGGRATYLDPGGNWINIAGTGSGIMGVNNLGQMVGYTTVGNQFRTTIWNADGTLAHLLGVNVSIGNNTHINDRGEVVSGRPGTGGPSNAAVYWSAMTGEVPLDSLLDSASTAQGYRITGVLDFNNRGQGIALGWKLGMQSWDGEMVLLDPVPEPATLAAFSLGTLALLRRRRVRTQ